MKTKSGLKIRGPRPQPADLRPQFEVWLEQDGLVVMDRQTIALLETIQKTDSIIAAARYMKIPYRLAWAKLNQTEAGLQMKLVERNIGGKGGGGTQLTSAGCQLITEFQRLSAGFEATVEKRFGAFLKSLCAHEA